MISGPSDPALKLGKKARGEACRGGGTLPHTVLCLEASSPCPLPELSPSIPAHPCPSWGSLILPPPQLLIQQLRSHALPGLDVAPRAARPRCVPRHVTAA